MKGLKFIFIVFVLSVSIGLIAGCSGGSSSGGGAGVVLTGNWSGTWVSSGTPYWGYIAVSMVQSGTSISGTAVLTGSPNFPNCSMSGSVSGNTMNATGVSGSNTVVFTATCTSTSMNGTYAVSAGSCAGDYGTFSMNKQT